MKSYKSARNGYKVSMDDDLSKPSYLDSKKFISYRTRVEQIVLSATEPVTTRYIHLQLLDEAEPRWTLDSLECSLLIERIPGFIDKFTVKHERRITPARFNDGLAETEKIPRPY